jgi:hypothetical protein
MVRGDFPRRRCKAILQSVDVPKPCAAIDTRTAVPDSEARRVDMQSSDVIEVVTHLLAMGSVKLLYSRMRLPFLRALRLYWWHRGRVSHSDVQHRSLLESDVALLVRRVEIPVIGRDGEISGVLCRNLPLTSASRSIPLTQDQDTAIIPCTERLGNRGHVDHWQSALPPSFSEATPGRWHEMSNGPLSPEHIQQRDK